MITSKETKTKFDNEISKEEYEIIKKFLNLYKNQKYIIADSYCQIFDRIPLGEKNTFFHVDNIDKQEKELTFTRKIYHNNKEYIVVLELHRDIFFDSKTRLPIIPKELKITEFKIIDNDTTHYIDIYNAKDISLNLILNSIKQVFQEDKIISPSQTYISKMYNDKTLQNFIKNHEWQKITKGIKQQPTLANALFIDKEKYWSNLNFAVDFTTILYQLVAFRTKNIHNFSKKDLNELDKLILSLSRKNLLKIELIEDADVIEFGPTDSILLSSDQYKQGNGMHISSLYSTYNGGLEQEQKNLSHVLEKVKAKNY